VGAFAHDADAQMAGWNGLRIKTTTVIFNAQLRTLCVPTTFYDDLARFGMFGDIV
jgi:hypothetical protein